MATGTAVILDEGTRGFYKEVLELLNREGMPYLVGGAYAFERYTGIARHTKDFDIFIRKDDYAKIAATLQRSGIHTELTFPHWLGKAFREDAFIDLIYGGGNGIAVVDEEWFEHAVDEVVFDVPVKLCPAEEIIWSKSFIMERERFDGADIAHILRARAGKLDWVRLLRRFADNWRVLQVHLILFGFIYPERRHEIPAKVMSEFNRKLEAELQTQGEPNLCQGTILSRQQYLVDIDRWKLDDARLAPRGAMSEADIAHWTAAIEKEKS